MRRGGGGGDIRRLLSLTDITGGIVNIIITAGAKLEWNTATDQLKCDS